MEQTGAIDWFLIEFQDKEIDGALVPALLDLVDRRLVRILDALILTKDVSGGFTAQTTSDLTDSQRETLGDLAGASSGVLSAEDAAEAVEVMQPDSQGLLIVFENLWSLPFAVAAREAGGQLVASGQIPTQAIVAALDALDDTSTD